MAPTPSSTPLTCSDVNGWLRIGIAATAEMSGLRQLMADDIDASTKRCAQFITRCPLPGTTTSSAIHHQSLSLICPSDWPDTRTTGLITAAATKVTPVVYSSAPLSWRACFEAIQ